MDIKLLKKLCCSYGVSGREKEISGVICDNMKELCDNISVDNLGNITCIKYGTTDKTVTLDAHMDSVGFIVTKIHDDGFVSFSSIGGIDERILSSQEVVIHGREKVCGIITAKPPHITGKSESYTDIKNMFIDTGITKDVDKLINVGDLISFKSHFSVLNKYVSGTALDNRAGVASIIEVFRNLKDVKLPYNLSALFSVREEIGLRGAYFIDNLSNLTIVIDVTHAKTPDESRDVAFDCSKGVALGYGPNIDRYYYNLLTASAQKNKLPYQVEILEGSSGTNAWAYQTLKQGTPCLLLSFPLKYMHTPVECISLSDYDNMVSHIIGFLKDLDTDKIKSNELTNIGDFIG